MQIARPVIIAPLQSVPIALAPSMPQVLLRKAQAGLRWLTDIDDGGGAIVCFLCVLAVFGTLVFRLVELDRSLDAQSLKCTAVDKNSLQMRCEFE